MRFFQQSSANNSNNTTTVNTAAVLLSGSNGNGKKSNNSSTLPSSVTNTTTASNAAAAAAAAAANLGSLKKRAAPLPPATRTNPHAHSRNSSDYGVSLPAQRVKPTNSGESASSQSRKSLAGDSYVSSDNKMRSFHQSAAHLRNYLTQFLLFLKNKLVLMVFPNLAGAKLVLPKGELPQLRKLHGSAASLSSNSNRPRGPPPPTPAGGSTVVTLTTKPLSRNGRSTESLSSAPSDGEFNEKPPPPARGMSTLSQYHFHFLFNQFK